MTTDDDDIERLEERKESLEDRLTSLDDDPQAWVVERKQALDDALRQVETRYEPEREGNVPMYDHLRGLLAEIAREERAGVAPKELTAVQEETARLEDRIEQTQDRIDELESDE